MKEDPLFHEKNQIDAYQLHISNVTTTTALVPLPMASFVTQESSNYQVLLYYSNSSLQGSLLSKRSIFVLRNM